VALDEGRRLQDVEVVRGEVPRQRCRCRQLLEREIAASERIDHREPTTVPKGSVQAGSFVDPHGCHDIDSTDIESIADD
jgi:hypothetical protein